MKRSRVSAEESPVKKHRKDSIPVSPYTPYPLIPSDSPSNPFKRTSHVVSLPPVSSFRKHIPLRFQLHRRSIGFANGGVHRIVQVPLNYTFTHLRALIAWLFHVPAKHTNGKAGKEDYLFEIKTNVIMHAPRLKPGIIKSAETSVKLSHSKDPCRSSDLDELEGDQDDQYGDDLDDGEGDWIWGDEEDYTLDHVWVTGLKADRAIIYHHYPSTQVHITVNTTKLPRRRGKSNVPHVFSARGRVHLSLAPLPRPLFTRSILHTLSSSPTKPSSLHSFHARRPDPKRGSIFSPNPFNQPSRLKGKKRKEIILVEDSDEDSDDPDELHDRLIDPKYWTESHYAFGRYLLSFLDPKGRSYAHLDDDYFEEKQPYDPFENDDDEEEGGQGETFVEEESLEQLSSGSPPALTTSSTRCSSSLPPSSPPALALSSSPSCSSSPLSLSPDLPLELHTTIVASHYPNKKYAFTPAPPIARKHRLQLERLERRIEKGKKGTYLCEYDEEDVDEQDEVDELLEDEVVVLKEGELWDPFGDEEEV